MPRSKIQYELSFNDFISILIIPDFDFDVDSGNYQCLSKNSFGITTQNINIDKKFKSKFYHYKRF